MEHSSLHSSSGDHYYITGILLNRLLWAKSSSPIMCIVHPHTGASGETDSFHMSGRMRAVSKAISVVGCV